ncbi:beta-mannanase [Frankia sp. AgB1.9]|uniref:glycoside hydrolase family 26 protein n=1 Tax=unclassified Frankia TaxID=2632575 RepID=UPI0019341274|nr:MULTISPECIES: glycosyl hydrolase [unclassified Frankia]MBL7493657.1 beta-mannanase [Frankia sp. AgW1.1]MBL7551278.1 beta-mannanase [Frankia sp. AgB1.9]MBL7621532.1 beta-mannanase [Frankia sp. AgB1.8]
MRLTVPRVVAVVLVVVLAGYVFRVAPHLSGPRRPGAAVPAELLAPSTELAAAPTQFPEPGKTFVGIMTTAGVHSFTNLLDFTQKTSYKPRAYQFSEGWAEDKFNASDLNKVASLGMMPIVAWEPWDFSTKPQSDKLRGAQPKYRLSNIIDGSFDSYIRSWARGVKTLDYTIGLRFAHEMNGYWYPWAEQANGNQPGQYVQAWRHVHDIFTQEGAANVVWIWSPNVTYPNSTPLAELYPGDAYVDWVGFSGYYGTVGNETYKSFDEIFASSLAEVQTVTQKPIVITETGAADNAGLKAAWIAQLFASLPRYPEIIGVIWQESTKEVDWRVAVSPAASRAFAVGAANPRYDATWRWTSRPELTLPLRP